MHKPVVLVSLLVAALAASARTAAPAAAASGAAPAASSSKHKLHAPKLRKGATPATNPEATPDKKGGA